MVVPIDPMTRAMQLARRMVGQNEFEISRENAMHVFRSHGGVFDRDNVPVLGPCQSPDCNSKYAHCDRQRLAFSILLALSAFETAQEMLVEKVARRVKEDIVREYGGV